MPKFNYVIIVKEKNHIHLFTGVNYIRLNMLVKALKILEQVSFTQFQYVFALL